MVAEETQVSQKVAEEIMPVDCLDLSGGLSERRVNFVSHRHKKDTKEINYKKVGQRSL